MNRIQRKLMNYHHAYFMASGFLVFMLGFLFQLVERGPMNSFNLFQVMMVIGALLLGYGTGRCDQKTCS